MFVIFIIQTLMQVNRASWAHSSLKNFLTLTNPISSSLHCVFCWSLQSYFANIPWANFLKSWQCFPGWASLPFRILLLFLGPAHLITVCWNLHTSIGIKSLPFSSPLPSTCCFFPGKWKTTICSSWSTLDCPCCGHFPMSWPSVLASCKHLKSQGNSGGWCCALFCI